MKGLANGEIKVIFNSSDDYRKCTILFKFNELPEETRKTIGQIKFHTYQLRAEKPFTVFIRSCGINKRFISLKSIHMRFFSVVS